MDTRRHPLAGRFSETLRRLRTQTATLHDPNLRTKSLPRLRAGLAELLRGVPPPAPLLREAIYKLQRDLSRLSRSRRYEFAIALRIDEALSYAESVAGCPPASASEVPTAPAEAAREFTIGAREFFIVPCGDGWKITGPGEEVLDVLPTKIAALRAAVAMIRTDRLRRESDGDRHQPASGRSTRH